MFGDRIINSTDLQREDWVFKKMATCIQSLACNPNALLNDVLRQRQTGSASVIDNTVRLLRFGIGFELAPALGVALDVFHDFLDEFWEGGAFAGAEEGEGVFLD